MVIVINNSNIWDKKTIEIYLQPKYFISKSSSIKLNIIVN
jgi:hypothetical protein